MPSIATIVADLDNRSIPAIGAKVDAAVPTFSAPLSLGHAARYYYDDMTAALSATNRVSFNLAANAAAANGRYLHYQDGWSTLCKLDVHFPIVVSGNFSGCAYKVFKSAAGEIFCAHIARPGGAASDANVTLLGDYATQKGWQEFQHISTVGQIGTGGCIELVMVSQLVGGRVDTIRLNINNTGQVVAKQLTSTAIPP